jgi:tryptophanyl-tRNA synthetase
VRHDPERKPGVSNLLETLSACTGPSPHALAGQFICYRDSRTPSLTQSWNCSRPCSIATPRSRPILDTSRLLHHGATAASTLAAPALARVKEAIGLLPAA